MNPSVLRRFILYMGILTVAGFSFWMGWRYLTPTQPGDFETRHGGQLLSDGQYEEALERFDAALEVNPDHRGALQGRATSYLQLERYDEAEGEFTYLIEFLEKRQAQGHRPQQHVVLGEERFHGTRAFQPPRNSPPGTRCQVPVPRGALFPWSASA